MAREDLEDLPALVVPDGYALRTYRPGDEPAWCEIMEGNVGRNWTVEKCRAQLTQDPRFSAEKLFFATHGERPVASACAWRKTADPGPVGELHMVAALEAHRGRGLGHLLNAAVLRCLKELGHSEAHLQTDDWRLPAIVTYLHAGFQPVHTHPSHVGRWEKILSELEAGHASG